MHVGVKVASIAFLGALSGCGSDERASNGGQGGMDGGPKDATTESVICVVLSCEELGAECGVAPNGCGATVACGECPAAAPYCGGSGPNRCGTKPCPQKQTCQTLGHQCGVDSDQCDATVDCGTCPSGTLCINFLCKQDPTCPTCASLQWKCGTGYTGCDQLDCGSCKSGLDCTNHVCVGCFPGATRACGPGVGLCVPGVETCDTNGLWTGTCVGSTGPSNEVCDGLDQDCDGTKDDGTFLPDHYDAIDWIEVGYFGFTSPSILVAWDGKGAVWDVTAGKVTGVFSLATAWGTGGTPPPAKIDTIAVLPKEAFGWTTDNLLVTSGPNAWALDQNSAWTTTSVSSLLGVTTIDAITTFLPGDVGGITATFLVFASGGKVYTWTAANGIQGPAEVEAMFCTAGTTGDCPTGVGSLARIPGSPTAGILIEDSGITYTSPLLSGANGIVYAWSSALTSAVSCQQ